MRQERKYEIVTFDVEGVVGAAALRDRLARCFGLPDSSSVSWEAFVDALPQLSGEKFYFILYNGLWLYRNDQELEETLRAVINKLMCLNKVSAMLIDSLDQDDTGEKQCSLRFLFNKEPFQYGLRGDAHLWEELGEYFGGQALPKDEEDFTEQLFGAIESLTGQSIETGKDFFIEKYNSGGMSSGYVNSDFWINIGIPLLVGRYKMIHANRQ